MTFVGFVIAAFSSPCGRAIQRNLTHERLKISRMGRGSITGSIGQIVALVVTLIGIVVAIVVFIANSVVEDAIWDGVGQGLEAAGRGDLAFVRGVAGVVLALVTLVSVAVFVFGKLARSGFGR